MLYLRGGQGISQHEARRVARREGPMCRSKNWPKKTPHTKSEATLKGNLGYLVNKFPIKLSTAQKYSKKTTGLTGSKYKKRDV